MGLGIHLTLVRIPSTVKLCDFCCERPIPVPEVSIMGAAFAIAAAAADAAAGAAGAAAAAGGATDPGDAIKAARAVAGAAAAEAAEAAEAGGTVVPSQVSAAISMVDKLVADYIEINQVFKASRDILKSSGGAKELVERFTKLIIIQKTGADIIQAIYKWFNEQNTESDYTILLSKCLRKIAAVSTFC